MKSILYSLLAIGVFFFCESTRETLNADQVPAAVQQAFNAAHPDTKAAWEAEGDGTFEAEFKLAGEEASATYTSTGELLETEVEIKRKALPAAVIAAIAAQFTDNELEEAAKITYPDGRIAYEAELEGKDDQKFDAVFSADGKLIKQIDIAEEKDKD